MAMSLRQSPRRPGPCTACRNSSKSLKAACKSRHSNMVHADELQLEETELPSSSSYVYSSKVCSFDHCPKSPSMPSAEHLIADAENQDMNNFFVIHQRAYAYFLQRILTWPALSHLIASIIGIFVAVGFILAMYVTSHAQVNETSQTSSGIQTEEDKPPTCDSRLALLNIQNQNQHKKQEEKLEMQQFVIETMKKQITQIENQYAALLLLLNNTTTALTTSLEQSDILEKKTIKLIQDQIEVYDADHIGMADFASRSMGGRVISTPNTQPYLQKFSSSLVSYFIPTLLPNFNDAEGIMEPGKCWAFKGSKGNMLIQLATLVNINAVTLDHVSPKLTVFGNIQSAPKDFILFGMANEQGSKDHIVLGRFSYNKDGVRRQTFSVQHTTTAFKRVMLSILTNHGNPNYTCVYRFRVHGVAEWPDVA